MYRCYTCFKYLRENNVMENIKQINIILKFWWLCKAKKIQAGEGYTVYWREN